MKHILDIPRTAMEVFNMLPEGTLCEVIDNTLYMSPSPTTYHQRLLGKLFARIQTFIEDNVLGEAFVAPCDVYLDDQTNVVQPDILFIKKERLSIIERNGIIGAPDLIIEILSTNKSHGSKQELELYERNQVPEYIIIDPETRQVWHYLLNEHKYTALPTIESGKLLITQLDLNINF
ncbi:Uma2 family endonuclease [Mucilaginibacter galii]|uniref:Restriction endonuclease n=1 Tax=Mucilaginibacter galii TaxID=2005073 RepID=A0A917N277_9SPHI|nr:Uma2 family endonuclease [Mucilaginibacter galii]GGI49777.1 restriction endonuclease [Mucilaginibacter galii]